jgi:hypothetical protein
MLVRRRKVPSNALGRWYEGKLVPTENQPKSTTLRILHYERHWTAEVARVLVKFYLNNWQWVIGTVIGVVSLWVAVLALR